MSFDLNTHHIKAAGDALAAQCHGASYAAGWWHDLRTGQNFRAEVRDNTRLGKALVAEKLCLVHSEVSEAMEGHRKGRADDHLPQYPMVIVEIADAFVRLGDLAGALIPDGAGFTLGDVIAAKMAYNAQRADHKPEARAAAGGKAY